MKMYRISNYYVEKQTVDEIEVERVTDKSVWINGRRRDKMSNHYRYFESRIDAINYLINEAKRDVVAAEGVLEVKRRKLADILPLLGEYVANHGGKK